jgi:hypothetical protein
MSPEPSIPVVPVPGLSEQAEKNREAAAGAVIPPKVVPWLTAIVAAALVASRSAPVGHPVQVVADALTDVAVLFGLASPGWRRK